MRFRKKAKLSPGFIGLYKILERIGKVAYRFTLHAFIDRRVSRIPTETVHQRWLTLPASIDRVQYEETPFRS